MSLFDVNGTLHVVVDRQILFAAETWRLLGTEARSGHLAVYGAFCGLGGDPWERVFTHVSPDDASVASDALAKRFNLPNVLVSVEAEELLRDPCAYDGRHLETVGVWEEGFELSRFLGATMTAPAPANAPAYDRHGDRKLHVRARGLWQAERRPRGLPPRPHFCAYATELR